MSLPAVSQSSEIVLLIPSRVAAALNGYSSVKPAPCPSGGPVAAAPSGVETSGHPLEEARKAVDAVCWRRRYMDPSRQD